MQKIINSFTGDVEYTVGKNFIANFDYQGDEPKQEEENKESK